MDLEPLWSAYVCYCNTTLKLSSSKKGINGRERAFNKVIYVTSWLTSIVSTEVENFMKAINWIISADLI